MSAEQLVRDIRGRLLNVFQGDDIHMISASVARERVEHVLDNIDIAEYVGGGPNARLAALAAARKHVESTKNVPSDRNRGLEAVMTQELRIAQFLLGKEA